MTVFQCGDQCQSQIGGAPHLCIYSARARSPPQTGTSKTVSEAKHLYHIFRRLEHHAERIDPCCSSGIWLGARRNDADSWAAKIWYSFSTIHFPGGESDRRGRLRAAGTLDKRGFGMVLAGNMFKFGDSGVGVIIGEIDRADRLIARVWPMFMLEAKNGKAITRTIPEESIERAGVNNMGSADLVGDPEEIDADLDMDVRMVEHSFEHSRIAVQGHLLMYR